MYNIRNSHRYNFDNDRILYKIELGQQKQKIKGMKYQF